MAIKQNKEMHKNICYSLIKRWKMEKTLRERFEISADFDEMEYRKENNGAENFKWKNSKNGQSIRIFLFEGKVYHYIHHIPKENNVSIAPCISLTDADKEAAEKFLEKMFPSDVEKLVLNIEKAKAFQFDDYKCLKIEYEQFFGERYVYSYGACMCLHVYQNKRVITECRGFIAHINCEYTPFKLGFDDYKKAFPIELSYEKILKRGTLPIYSVKVGYLNELDGAVVETRFEPIKTMTHGVQIEDNTFYETDMAKLAQMKLIDKNCAYNIILSKNKIRHVMVETKNEEFVPAITIADAEGFCERKIRIIATTGELIN